MNATEERAVVKLRVEGCDEDQRIDYCSKVKRRGLRGQFVVLKCCLSKCYLCLKVALCHLIWRPST